MAGACVEDEFSWRGCELGSIYQMLCLFDLLMRLSNRIGSANGDGHLGVRHVSVTYSTTYFDIPSNTTVGSNPGYVLERYDLSGLMLAQKKAASWAISILSAFHWSNTVGCTKRKNLHIEVCFEFVFLYC